jgi:uncharacterized membrane protein YcgQ (UPF0703/DUF1980 family)
MWETWAGRQALMQPGEWYPCRAVLFGYFMYFLLITSSILVQIRLIIYQNVQNFITRALGVQLVHLEKYPYKRRVHGSLAETLRVGDGKGGRTD